MWLPTKIRFLSTLTLPSFPFKSKQCVGNMWSYALMTFPSFSYMIIDIVELNFHLYLFVFVVWFASYCLLGLFVIPGHLRIPLLLLMCKYHITLILIDFRINNYNLVGSLLVFVSSQHFDGIRFFFWSAMMIHLLCIFLSHY